MSRSSPTYIGTVQSVTGGIISVRLRENLVSSLVLVDGESYRIGQIGAFLRIPLGYANLYGVCSQVGAAAVPESAIEDAYKSSRWLSITLFGESISNRFERGVSQYPTVGDEVHLVTTSDLEVIYNSVESPATINVGNLAASSGISGTLDLARVVARHCTIVGSTGSGKSNLVAVLLETIATQGYPSARVLVIDPHGEYGNAIGDKGYVFRIKPEKPDEKQLTVPFWALPFDELREIAIGGLQQATDAIVRDRVLAMKSETAKDLVPPISDSNTTADSPIPFDIKQLWFESDEHERATYEDNNRTTRMEPTTRGSATELKSSIFPATASGNVAPFAPKPRGISKQLEFMRSRLLDGNFRFLFNDTKDADGNVIDIDHIVSSWVGHDRHITVLDLSGIPPEILSMITGTLLRIVYDTLFWAKDLPVSGRNQPLLIALEEAHLFLPKDGDTPANRTIQRIAKEGRKYGVGLLVITQRPTEIDGTILSQCGTMIALRLTNTADRNVVTAAMPDDLGNVAAIMPSLRTGEGLVIGEAMPIPSRIQFRRAINKPVGDDPNLAEAWRLPERPDPKYYKSAVQNWRSQSAEE